MSNERLQIGYLEVKNRPTVNGTGVLLQGEASTGGGGIVENAVYTTGTQTITGPKDFTARPTFNNLNLITTGDLINLELNITGLKGLTTQWSGNADNLNLISDRYQGLITYITGVKDLYLCHDSSFFTPSYRAWEKIITSNVDTTSNIITSSTLTLGLEHNSLVVQINSPNLVNVYLPSSNLSLQQGFNVTIVQLGLGDIQFNNNAPGLNQIFTLRNRLGLTRTAGQYAVASLLRVGISTDVFLYGDLV